MSTNPPTIEPPSMFLDSHEVRSLTKRIHHAAQVKVLRSMGIEHVVRPDGSVVVSRTHVEKVLDGAVEATQRQTNPTPKPNWHAI